MTDALKTLLLGGVLTAVGWLLVTTGVVQLSMPDLGLPSPRNPLPFGTLKGGRITAV